LQKEVKPHHRALRCDSERNSVTHQSVSWRTPQSYSWPGCTHEGCCPSIHHWTETWHHVTQQTNDCSEEDWDGKGQTAFF